MGNGLVEFYCDGLARRDGTEREICGHWIFHPKGIYFIPWEGEDQDGVIPDTFTNGLIFVLFHRWSIMRSLSSKIGVVPPPDFTKLNDIVNRNKDA